MAKIDIMAVFRSMKTAIAQGIEYAKNGYSRRELSPEEKIVADDTPFDQKNLTLDNIPVDIENQITSSFKTIIEFIEAYLLADMSAGFYGALMCEFELGINYQQKGLVDVDVKSFTPRLTFNPFYCQEYSINEILGAVNVELEKILYLHPAMYGKLNPQKDQKKHDNLEAASNTSASELVFNDVVLSTGNNRIKLNPEQYTRTNFEEELEGRRDVKRTESLDYYFQVAEAFRRKRDGNNGNGPGAGLPMPGQGQGKGLSMPGNSNNGSDIHDWESAGNTSDIEDKLKDMCKSAYDSLSEKQRGLTPAGITSQIEQMFKRPEMNWKQYFRKFVGLIPANHRPSRMRLNRRQPDRFDLSGQLSDKVVRVVICIDTSGSMSNDILSYCLNEIYGMAKSYKTEYTIIECDAQVGRVYTIKDPREIKPDLTGRGGTSYVPAIEYINSHKFKDAVMVYFTDGYGDYEIPKPRTYRNLWVVTEGDESVLSLKQPYGEVKSLCKDPEYMARFKRGI